MDIDNDLLKDSEAELAELEREFDEFLKQDALNAQLNFIEPCNNEIVDEVRESFYFSNQVEEPLDYEYSRASESLYEGTIVKLNRRFCPHFKYLTPSSSSYFKRLRKRRHWSYKVNYTGSFKQSIISSDNILFQPETTRLPLISGGSPAKKSMRSKPWKKKYVEEFQVTVDLAPPEHIFEDDSDSDSDDDKTDLSFELADLSVTINNNELANTSTAVTTTERENMEVEIPPQVEDIVVTVMNVPPLPPATPVSTEIFGNICLKHFMESNCRDVECPMKHQVPKSWRRSLRSYHLDEIWSAYNYCKGSKFMLTVFPHFAHAFLEHKQPEYLIRLFCDIAQNEFNSEFGMIILNSLNKLEFDILKFVKFVINEISDVSDELSNFFLRYLVDERMEENWECIEMLLDRRQSKLDFRLVNDMINIVVAPLVPNKKIIWKINDKVFNEHLFDLKDCDELMAKRFCFLLSCDFE